MGSRSGKKLSDHHGDLATQCNSISTGKKWLSPNLTTTGWDHLGSARPGLKNSGRPWGSHIWGLPARLLLERRAIARLLVGTHETAGRLLAQQWLQCRGQQTSEMMQGEMQVRQVRCRESIEDIVWVPGSSHTWNPTLGFSVALNNKVFPFQICQISVTCTPRLTFLVKSASFSSTSEHLS